jgi:type IV secretion system protein VirD4
MVIFDPKGGATFDMTVRYRTRCSDILVFAPLDQESACINILDTVHTFRDAQAVAKSHIAPGQMVRETATSLHFRELAGVLLQGGILHVLDTSRRKSMAGVLDFFTVTHEKLEDCLEDMISAKHSDPELHKLIVSMAREIQKVKDRELSGVWTTMMRGLHLYRDPNVARHTDTSDLDLDAVQYGPRPVTLYLVAPSPEELKQYHPLYRVVLDTLFRRLSLHPEESYKTDGRRVLVLANEFPAYGYMPRLEDGAATLRGYGIKLCLIAQDLEQFWNTYGKDTALWGNLHMKLFQPPQ